MPVTGTRILLVDDHRVVIEGIKSALREHRTFDVVAEALNGRDAVRLVGKLQPDIVVMDISMTDLNGIDATLQIKKLHPKARIIIFTMYSNIEYVIDLLNAGIAAYVLKEDPMSELIKAIETVARGGSYFSSAVPPLLPEALGAPSSRARSAAGYGTLSLREREVFQLLAEGESIKAIAGKLHISPKTVESHKYHIMEKLNARTLADLTKLAIQRKMIQV
jgi:DNA-binding NarL/FixJ family response regulator